MVTLLNKLRKINKQNVSYFLEKSKYPLPPPPGYSPDEAFTTYSEVFEKAFKFLKMNRIHGGIGEFGTFRGFTAWISALKMKKYAPFYPTLDLFDSFEGLPEITEDIDKNSYEIKTYNVWKPGSMGVSNETPNLIRKAVTKLIDPSQLNIHIGFFNDTLKGELFKDKLALVHIDCDLYDSTQCVFNYLVEHDLFQDGTILLFDDYNSGRANPEYGERKAFSEFLNKHKNYSTSHFYYYGWHGATFILHKQPSKSKESHGQ